MAVYVLAKSKVTSLVVTPPLQRRFLLVFIPLIIAYLFFMGDEFIARASGLSVPTVTGIAIGLGVVSYMAMIAMPLLFAAAFRRQALRATESTAPLIRDLGRADNVDDYFSKLIQINLKNMEQYYLMVGAQTDKSYAVTRVAAVLGFVILLTGIVIGLIEPTLKLAYVTMGSGAIVQFISAIFFWIYSRTVTQLNVYHERLVSVQDTMLALKIAQVIGNADKKDETMAALTLSLIAAPQVGPSAQSAPNKGHESPGLTSR